MLNQSRSKSLKLRSEISGLQKKIDNLVLAVEDGTLPKDVIQSRIQKLKADKERLELDLVQGEVVAFPRINLSKDSIESFRGACKEILMTGDVKKRQAFLKTLIKKIDLTKTTCEIHYDLARLVVTHQASSTLKDNLVELNGIEPSAS